MDKGVLLPYFNKLELQERWKSEKYQKYTILMIELVFQLYNGKYWVDIKICLSKTIESISEKLIIQISVSCSVDHQIQFLSSQHMKVLKEQPWHRLQLEHISPSAQVPYLNCQIVTIPGPGNVLTWSIFLHTSRLDPSGRRCYHRSLWLCCSRTSAGWRAGVPSRRGAGGSLQSGPGWPGWPPPPPPSSSSPRKSCLRLGGARGACGRH